MAVILVVEDDPDCAELLDLHLRKRGHDVSLARTGAQALERIVSLRPDAAVMDLRLPGVDGVRLVEILRGDELTRELPILLLSAFEKGWVAHRLPDDPRVQFLGKPIDFALLDRHLDSLLSS
jgi:CheY-like chemotaxis protein